VTPERQVRVIPGKIVPEYMQYLPKRACAYVRVSTGHAGQMNSLRNQTEYYERLIKGNPGYVFCGIYSDAGISGSKEDRPGFQAMMEAARRHQVDLILAKSISRFARKAELLLSAVRELKGLGVGVIFEEHRINTLSAEGELLLTVLASFAEEERKSVSTNIQWSIRAGYRKIMRFNQANLIFPGNDLFHDVQELLPPGNPAPASVFHIRKALLFHDYLQPFSAFSGHIIP